MMREDDLWEEHSRIMHWASGLHQEDEVLRARVREIEAELGKRGQEHQLALTAARKNHLQELQVLQAREIDHLSAKSNAADLTGLASILTEIDGSEVAPQNQSVFRVLTRVAIRCATQKHRIDDLEAALAAQNMDAGRMQGLVEAATRAISMQVEIKEAAWRTEESLRQAALERDRELAEARRLLDDAASRAEDREKALLQEAASLRQAAQERDHELAEARRQLNDAASQAEGRETALLEEAASLRQAALERDREFAEARRLLDDAASRSEGRETALLQEAASLRRAALERDHALIAEREVFLRDDVEELRRMSAFGAHFDAMRRAYQAVLFEHRQYIDALAWAREHVRIWPRRLKEPLERVLTKKKLELFRAAGFFDAEYYRSNAGLAKQSDAWSDFRARGCRAGISCNPILSTPYLVAHVPSFSGRSASYTQVVASGLYDDVMHPLFDPEYYVISNKLSLSDNESPLTHYMVEGRRRGLSTHPLIDVDWLREKQSDIETFDLVRYVSDPAWYRLPIHPLFDADFYMQSNSDAAASGINPLEHYVAHGWRENRAPNRLFDNYWYLATYPDVAKFEFIPLSHYSLFGAHENRKPHPFFDPIFYRDTYRDLRLSSRELYSHFLNVGWAEGRLPSSRAASVVAAYPAWPSAKVMEHLLTGRVEFSAIEPTLPMPASKYTWGRSSENHYYLPQRLRDYIIDRFGEEVIDFYVSIFSVISRYENNTKEFDFSPELDEMLAGLRFLSKKSYFSIPSVSIVIPVHNNLVYTLTCIYSILQAPANHSFEIIVADDVSTDRTAEIISAIGGCVRHLRQASNVGFLHNCNEAAARSSGRYIIFLNNDTVVFPGWLEHLITPMEADRSVGLTGSKLINGDGTLQEAGGILWRDGSAWNYGRNQEPWLPEFNYAKDVDYISGASIALPRDLWEELGGFDPIYAPAYCEDSDIAFRVRAAGYRTRYQPHSMLVHHEGRSHGRDVESGIKNYQILNNVKFFERWRDTLENDHEPNAENVFLARDRSRKKPHILIVDHYAPQWDRDAGSRTMFVYIKLFAESGFAVTFWSDNLYEDREYVPTLQRMGVEVIYSHAYIDRFSDWLSSNGKYLDYTLLSRPHIAEKYVDDLANFPNIRKMYYGHDLHFRRIMLEHAVSGNDDLLAEAEKWKDTELKICSTSDIVLYPSSDEIDFLRGHLPARVEMSAIPMIIFSDAELVEATARLALSEHADPFKLLFVGGFSHGPNIDGIVWFVEEVFPLLRQADKRFHLSIVGSNTPNSVRDLAGDGIDVLGRLSTADLDKLYRTSGLSIAPLRFGAGVKGKVIEAMANGVPVAMTSVGAQGIPDAEQMGFVGDTPRAFADAVLHATYDRPDALIRAGRAVAFLRDRYSEQAVRDLLASMIPEIGNNPRSSQTDAGKRMV